MAVEITLDIKVRGHAGAGVSIETIVLPPDLSEALCNYCFESGEREEDVIIDAIRLHLDQAIHDAETDPSAENPQ